MTDTLRDKLIQKGWVTPFNAATLVRLIEDHYADEPAVPNGDRELAAVTGQPNWRGLCEELLQALEGEGYANWPEGPDGNPLIENARAALADEPAVPEGREPAAVITEPSDPELADAYWKAWHGHNGRTLFASHYAGLRAVLARWGNLKASLTSSPPADGEVAELVAWLRANSSGIYRPAARAAELLQRQALVPVSVSERPWEREGWCDAEGRFWAEHISRSGVASWRCAAASDLGGWAVRCLPAHALPLPEVNNG